MRYLTLEEVMETFLILNGFEIDDSIYEQEQLMLKLASGELTRDSLNEWIKKHVK